jgi:hypothetical protein
VLEYNAYEMAAAALFLAAGVYKHPLKVPPGSSYAAACSRFRLPGCKIDSARLQCECLASATLSTGCSAVLASNGTGQHITRH